MLQSAEVEVLSIFCIFDLVFSILYCAFCILYIYMVVF